MSQPPPLRPLNRAAWRVPARRPGTLLAPERFRFLNVERALGPVSDWNNPAWPKLWLYNLHYFDDLNAADSQARNAWHSALIKRWIVENPAAQGNGWEPYPLSLRIVNWIKWSLGGNTLTSEALHSLAVQVRYLSGRLEYHLLGNHLFANAKALVFAGLFFGGAEGARWLRKGLGLVERELAEQVLADGGHFELSPMYHNIMLEDVLDLVNLLETAPETPTGRWTSLTASWRHYASSMLTWARTVTHPDGQIALVNDAAFGIASPLDEIVTYAARLGVGGQALAGDLVHLESSGYVRVQTGAAWALLDVGKIGPDYLPGHAHADSLSFELSVFGRRVVVDSGTSSYEADAERLRQRSTAAHNTVEIDGESSSEVWGSFRVARRAYPIGVELSRTDDIIRVRCAHNGYKRLRGHPIHHREWVFQEAGVAINDTVGGSFEDAAARFHFHPGCSLVQFDDRSGAIRLGNEGEIRWRVEHGSARLVKSTHHPEFGVSIPSMMLQVELVQAQARTRFDWAK